MAGGVNFVVNIFFHIFEDILYQYDSIGVTIDTFE